MKTKTIFEPKDFKGFGQIVFEQGGFLFLGESKVLGSIFKVGFFPENGRDTILLISMRDGYSFKFESVEDLCEYLNKGCFNPADEDVLDELANFTDNRF